MSDVPVLEASNDVRDRIALPDIGEKLVAEAFALRGAADKSGNVDEGESRRNDLLRAGDLRERDQARVGNGDVADVGLNRAKRIIGRLRRSRLRQRVEERRFADIRQTHDAALEAHEARPVPAGKWKNSRPMRGGGRKGKGRAEICAEPPSPAAFSAGRFSGAPPPPGAA